jgi:hypothetical protein
MKREICRRLEYLEALLAPPAPAMALIFIANPLPPGAGENLAPGERVVLDYYRHEGLLIEARERITADETDGGRRCEPESHLEDVIRELHSDCYYRSRGGSCRTCHGTAVADT